jgi:hypothetical protein
MLRTFFGLQNVKVFLISLVVALVVILNLFMLSKVTANKNHEFKNIEKTILK